MQRCQVISSHILLSIQFRIVKCMAADGLLTQETRASTAMVLNEASRNIPPSVPVGSEISLISWLLQGPATSFLLYVIYVSWFRHIRVLIFEMTLYKCLCTTYLQPFWSRYTTMQPLVISRNLNRKKSNFLKTLTFPFFSLCSHPQYTRESVYNHDINLPFIMVYTCSWPIS